MLIPSYYPLVGGSEVQLAGLLERLDHDRFSPFVLTRRLPGTRSVELCGRTPVFRLASPVRPATFSVASLRYLVDRRREFDVLHVHSLDSPALIGAVVKSLLPEKRYVQLIPRFGEGSSFDRQYRSPVGRTRLRFVMRRADAIIPLCPDADQALKTWGVPDEKVAPVPNGVDTDTFAPATGDEKIQLRRSLGIPADAFVGILVARLIARKNVSGALDAWRRVAEWRPGSLLVVAGDGPDRSSLEARAEEANRSCGGSSRDSGLGPYRVTFRGEMPRAEIVRWLRAADAYVSYSLSEGMSNAMLEAMSAGLPVIASRGPGIDQLVEHGRTGFLFSPEYPGDGAEYLVRMAEDPALLASMSASARALIEARYAFDAVARQMEKLYLGDSTRPALSLACPV